MRKVWRSLFGVALLAAGALVLAPSSSLALNFPVTKTADTADGVCDADCSLREAIIAANANGGPDTVTVPSSVLPYLLTIAGVTGEDASANGDLDITGDLTITGGGSATTVVDGGDAIRVFEVVGTANVTFSGLTVSNGLGGFSSGGGIENDGTGTVTITNCVISSNAGSFGGGINNNVGGTINIANTSVTGNTATGFGGGINNNLGGTVTLLSSTVSSNTATGFGGGINNNSSGPFTVFVSQITGNTGSNGGGINNNSGGGFTLTNSTVSGNTGTGTIGGGGILNNSSGPMTITGSTISGNTSAGAGGGIRNNSGGALTITNSTISGNTTTNTDGGGGIYKGSTGIVSLTNVTIIGNSAPGTSGGGIRNNNPSTPFNVLRSIVANSTSGGNCFGVTSLGNNLSSDATCNFVAAGDLPPADPLVGPLASNGGPTMTHALLAGSPAINAGGPGCPPPTTDQRLLTRPLGAACEIGSFECQTAECAALGQTPTPTPTGPAPTATPTPTSPAPTATPTPTVPTGQPVNVPTLSFPMLALLGLALATAAVFLLKR